MLDNIINNMLKVSKNNLDKNIKNIINEMYDMIISNEENIIKASNIDKDNNNGFIIDFKVINNIINNLKQEDIYYKDVILSKKDNDIIYGKYIDSVGNVVIISNGNTYVLLELLLRNIMVGNTVIFSDNGYMYGTNNLIINLMQSVLEKYQISKYLVNIYHDDNYENILDKYANINLVVCVGNHIMQNNILNKCKNKIIVSGYENYDIYIEDKSYLNFIDKILYSTPNINLYINSNLKIDTNNAILVDSLEEAISLINYNGSSYSTCIFTDNKENASTFINEVKSKIITVNTAPLIERILDINNNDLSIEKTVIYPNSFKITDTFNIKDEKNTQ